MSGTPVPELERIACALDAMYLHGYATEVRQAQAALGELRAATLAVDDVRVNNTITLPDAITELRERAERAERERDEAMRDMAAMQRDAKDYIELADQHDALMRERDEARAELALAHEQHADHVLAELRLIEDKNSLITERDEARSWLAVLADGECFHRPSWRYCQCQRCVELRKAAGIDARKETT